MLSHLPGLPGEDKLAIVPVGQSRRGLEGIVEPGEQIPVNKELLAQPCGWRKSRLAFMLSHLPGLPGEDKLAIVPVGQSRRGLEGIVEPGEQIPVNKELLA